MKININGQNVTVEGNKLTYEEIVAMVYPATITFSRGHKSKSEGCLCKGQSVKIMDGTIIDCVITGAA